MRQGDCTERYSPRYRYGMGDALAKAVRAWRG